MLIDTHCHLNFHSFEKDLDEVINRARESGVEKIIIPSTDLVSSKKALEIAEKYDGIYAAVGIHPHHAKDPKIKPDYNVRRQLEKLVVHPKVVAVGEIGVDYHVYRKTKYTDTSITKEYKQKQKELFLMQLDLAESHKLPTIIHCRDAHKDLIQTISTYSRTRENSFGFLGVFHAYGGSIKNLRLLISMGYYIGFDGNISYSPNWKLFVSSTPLDRLLLETDAPYLTPEPHRGTRNEPSYLPLVAQYVAEYKNTPLSSILSQTTKNAKKLFGI